MKKVFIGFFVLVVSSHCLWGAKANLFDSNLKQRVAQYVYGRDGEIPADIVDTVEKALGDENLQEAMSKALQEFDQRPKKILGVVAQPSRSRQNYFRAKMDVFNCKRDKAEAAALLQQFQDNFLGAQKELVACEDSLNDAQAERDQLREQLGQANGRVASLEGEQQGLQAAEASWGEEKRKLAGQIVTLTAVQEAHEKCPKPGVWEKNQAEIERLKGESDAQAALARQSAETLITERAARDQEKEEWGEEREKLKGQIRGFDETRRAASVPVPQNVWSKTQKKQAAVMVVGVAVVSSAATAAALKYWSSRNPNRG